MMVDDHSKANEQLNQIAQSKHLSVPQKVNSKDQATFDKLSALTGDAFDQRLHQAHGAGPQEGRT